MMSALLEKVKTMSSGLSRGFRGKVDFNSNAQALSAALSAGVVIIAKDGEVLGNAGEEALPLILTAGKGKRYLPEDAKNELLALVQTKVLSEKKPLLKLFRAEKGIDGYGITLIVPVFTEAEEQRERAGTIILHRAEKSFSEDDLVMVELFLAITAIELSHGKYDALEEIKRKEESIRSVVESLSYAELQVVKRVLQEIRDDTGFIVAAKIAAELQYAASVVASALRKLEGAAAIETRSRGFKGTYIHILNDQLVDIVAKVNVG